MTARIVGELKKLGVSIARATIYKICKDNGVQPPPVTTKRFPMNKWTQFIKCNMDSIVACDFFAKNVYTIFGKLTAYSLTFIHYGTRRVYVSSPTYNPDTEWLVQQSRNVSMWLEDEDIKMRYLVRDQDGKYPVCFDKFFEKIIEANDIPGHSKGKVIKTAIRCPPAVLADKLFTVKFCHRRSLSEYQLQRKPAGATRHNAYIESWIGHAKSECFNFFLMHYFSDALFGVLFAGVAGIMVFISLDELLPTAEKYVEHHLCIYGLIS